MAGLGSNEIDRVAADVRVEGNLARACKESSLMAGEIQAALIGWNVFSSNAALTDDGRLPSEVLKMAIRENLRGLELTNEY